MNNNTTAGACLIWVVFTFALGAGGGLIAFGGAVLYFGEPSERAELPADVEPMIDEAMADAVFTAYEVATKEALCMDGALGSLLLSIWLLDRDFDVAENDQRDLAYTVYESELNDCWDDARDQLVD